MNTLPEMSDEQVHAVATSGRWISVDERLPPACTMVLAYSATRRFGDKMGSTYINTRPCECVEDEMLTHWMPLPQAPSDQEEVRQPGSILSEGTASLKAENERLRAVHQTLCDGPADYDDEARLSTRLRKFIPPDARHGKTALETCLSEAADELIALATQLRACEQERDEARADLAPLQDFTEAVMESWHEAGDLDCFSLQHIAERCGLLAQATVIAPCGESCSCAENGESGETDCYRVQPVYQRAIYAAVARRDALTPTPGKE